MLGLVQFVRNFFDNLPVVRHINEPPFKEEFRADAVALHYSPFRFVVQLFPRGILCVNSDQAAAFRDVVTQLVDC